MALTLDPALKHDRRAYHRQGAMTMTERGKGVVEGNEGEGFGTWATRPWGIASSGMVPGLLYK